MKNKTPHELCAERGMLKGYDKNRVRVYTIRAHDLLWIRIDDEGFVTLIREIEYNSKKVEITLPMPIKTRADIHNLFLVMGLTGR